MASLCYVARFKIIWYRNVINSNWSFSNKKSLCQFSASQIDAFAQQQPGLETHLKNLNQGFTKYLERHIDTYERDIQRVGELFTKLHVVVQIDMITPRNDELSNSMSKISDSYNGIAELYKTKVIKYNFIFVFSWI